MRERREPSPEQRRRYFIGIALTLAFGALVFIIARARPAPTTGIALALGFGFATNLLPWLIMFPAMGFGPFGCAGPPALMLFRSSFVNHSIFAVGLALSTRALGLLRA
jgi:apolipoprotein N-acyltransferase